MSGGHLPWSCPLRPAAPLCAHWGSALKAHCPRRSGRVDRPTFLPASFPPPTLKCGSPFFLWKSLSFCYSGIIKSSMICLQVDSTVDNQSTALTLRICEPCSLPVSQAAHFSSSSFLPDCWTVLKLSRISLWKWQDAESSSRPASLLQVDLHSWGRFWSEIQLPFEEKP